MPPTHCFTILCVTDNPTVWIDVVGVVGVVGVVVVVGVVGVVGVVLPPGVKVSV